MRLGRIVKVEVGLEGGEEREERGDTKHRVTGKNYGSKWREPTYSLMKLTVRRRRRREN